MCCFAMPPSTSLHDLSHHSQARNKKTRSMRMLDSDRIGFGSRASARARPFRPGKHEREDTCERRRNPQGLATTHRMSGCSHPRCNTSRSHIHPAASEAPSGEAGLRGQPGRLGAWPTLGPTATLHAAGATMPIPPPTCNGSRLVRKCACNASD